MFITPAVSVLIPCYNAAQYLVPTLESIANQTLQSYEVIAVDDGSEDETLAILQRWAAQDARIRVFARPHQGIIPAMNYGLAQCRAPLVARLDADDLACPERLAQQTAFLNAHPNVGLVSCRVEGFPKENVRKGFKIYLDWLNALLTHEDLCRELFIESPLPHPSVMYRKELIDTLGGYEEHGWAEDYDLWLRMYLHGVEFAKLPEVCVLWREHEQRLTRTDGRYSVENFMRVKAHYLMRGPAANRDAVIVWGAGMNGRRLSKHLVREGAPLAAFIDVSPKKIGSTLRGKPIIGAVDLMDWWARYDRPIILTAVAARGGRQIIRVQLNNFGLQEGMDWWGVA